MTHLLPRENKNLWCDLDKWFLDQEIYFKKKKIESDEDKINHILLNLDVRHFGKLQKYLDYNQQNTISYEQMKVVLSRRLKKRQDPTMSKYDRKVDAIVDKMAIDKLNLENLENWLKKLRNTCNGEAKDFYLVTKILSRLTYQNKEKEIRNLLKQIDDEIKLTESRIVDDVIGKKTKKKLSSLLEIRNAFIEDLNY